MKLFYVFSAAVGMFVFVACTKDIGLNPDLVVKPVNACDSVTFAADIQPLFTNKCATCHFTGTTSGAPGDFTSYADIKTKADAGLIKNRAIVLHDMPQGGPPLSQAEMDLITCWLDAGAPNN